MLCMLHPFDEMARQLGWKVPLACMKTLELCLGCTARKLKNSVAQWK